MIQIAEERMKEISDKQIEAIRKIVQSRDFNLAEYIRLKRILDSRVITRRDASAFLEYCYAKVGFERYFNGHHHKAYAACCFCKGRDNLRKIENIKTGKRHWCCQTCRSTIADGDVIDVPTARTTKADFRNNSKAVARTSSHDMDRQKAPGVLSGQQQCRDSWVGLETGQ